ncbi:vesicle-associated membrane protein [Striga asiatica]|uniref:Vesicle-associated membrane protein n=1 Tax=Striga asiatica TaxID=4170 RepID=A0A5A7PV70_STRAF|nr:vesicle-associated membrane protein [Striga asiatica]
MAILYGLVARGTTVLAEFSAVTGNTGAVVRRILEKLCDTEPAESRLCFSQDRYIFHILRSDGFTFLCMANDTFGHMHELCGSLMLKPAPHLRGRIPFSYLEDIRMRFMKNYGRVAHVAPAYAMNDEFSRVLHQQMEFFSSNPSADTLNRVRGEVSEYSTAVAHVVSLFLEKIFVTGLIMIPLLISRYKLHSSCSCAWEAFSVSYQICLEVFFSDKVRTIMVDNIDKILERGDRIELLVDKTATMQDSAFHFRKQSKRLRRALWMKNAKLFYYLLTTKKEKMRNKEEQWTGEDVQAVRLGALFQSGFVEQPTAVKSESSTA